MININRFRTTAILMGYHPVFDRFGGVVVKTKRNGDDIVSVQPNMGGIKWYIDKSECDDMLVDLVNKYMEDNRYVKN